MQISWLLSPAGWVITDLSESRDEERMMLSMAPSLHAHTHVLQCGLFSIGSEYALKFGCWHFPFPALDSASMPQGTYRDVMNN